MQYYAVGGGHVGTGTYNVGSPQCVLLLVGSRCRPRIRYRRSRYLGKTVPHSDPPFPDLGVVDFHSCTPAHKSPRAGGLLSSFIINRGSAMQGSRAHLSPKIFSFRIPLQQGSPHPLTHVFASEVPHHPKSTARGSISQTHWSAFIAHDAGHTDTSSRFDVSPAQPLTLPL
jgi:hypothetical protein